jgi:hypothetical protein
MGQRGKYWTRTVSHVSDVFTKRFDFDKGGVVQAADSPRSVCSLRLVKDYNGHNYRGTDTIQGVTYNTALIPSLNTSHGYAIWTAANIASSHRKYHPVLPEGGDKQELRKAFYFCEWDGENWMKKEMTDGDTTIIHIGPDGDRHREYKLVHGQLINVARDIISIVMDKYEADIKDLQNRMSRVEEDIIDLRQRDAELEAVDQQIWAAIENEAKLREEVDGQIWSAIENEAKTREDADKQIWANIEHEARLREEVDKQLWKGIEAEAKIRETIDGQIWDAVNTESAIREEVDGQIWKAIETEGSIRENEDLKLWGAIANESKLREEVDNQIWTSLNAEIERSKAEDEYIKGRLINEQDSRYSCDEGVLVLGTDDPKNTITIQLNGNYGTF